MTMGHYVGAEFLIYIFVSVARAQMSLSTTKTHVCTRAMETTIDIKNPDPT